MWGWSMAWGFGSVREFVYLSDGGASVEGEGHRYQPWGFDGGLDGHPAALRLEPPMARSRPYRPRCPTRRSRSETASCALVQPVAGTASRLPVIRSASSTTCWMGSSVSTRHNATLAWSLARTARWMSRPRLERGPRGRVSVWLQAARVAASQVSETVRFPCTFAQVWPHQEGEQCLNLNGHSGMISPVT